MTDEMRTDTVEESAPKATMGEFTHSNPYTGRTFGQESAFERGPVVAADGGERNAGPRTSSDSRSDGGERNADAGDESEDETVADVDHEHPHDNAAAANRVFARGQGDDDGTGPV